jgi:SAM-dependent methyltransferase
VSVVWHDLECGSYREDMMLWRALAREHGDPVLDVGAGTGRIALDLLQRGHSLTALDSDPELISELERRAAGLELTTIVADARSFELDQQFALCIVPMQTIQLLGGPEGRAPFLRCVRAHLRPGGVLAIALADELEVYETTEGGPAPLPDMAEHDGIVYSSQPTAVRDDGDGFVLERRRERIATDGSRTISEDRVRLDRLTPDVLEREGLAAGFSRAERDRIPATSDYVGSAVVIFGG